MDDREMLEHRLRIRMLLAIFAGGYAFAGGLAMTVIALFVGLEKAEAALPFFSLSLPAATMVLGWFKGRDQGGS